MTRIAINGFGRIGRLFLRQAFGLPNIDIAAINDLGSVENLAYLLKYDTVYRNFLKSIAVQDGNLVIDGKEIKFLQIKESTELPWKDLEIDIVIESTGVFESYEKAKVHLVSGAKRVIITAPAKDLDGLEGKTVLMGINNDELRIVNLSSNGSCTTNAVAPVIKVLAENPGIEKAILNTVHAYTATQTITDSPVKGSDFRRGRAGAQNMVPSTTGAAIAVTRVIKELENKFDGIAIRVPIPTASIADITFIAKRETTVEEVNNILKEATLSPQWQGILKTTDEQIVSSDIIGEPYASIVDLKFTKVVGGNLVKVLIWYDNEWGYVATLVKHTLEAASLCT